MIVRLQHLRWKFTYSDHKIDRIGMWDKPGVMQVDQAWCQNKDHLNLAIIEAKKIMSPEIKPIVICEGWNFVNFEWVYGCAVNLGNLSQPQATTILGLAITTINEKITVGSDGKITKRKRTLEEKNQHLVGFGR